MFIRIPPRNLESFKVISLISRKSRGVLIDSVVHSYSIFVLPWLGLLKDKVCAESERFSRLLFLIFRAFSPQFRYWVFEKTSFLKIKLKSCSSRILPVSGLV